MKNVMIHINPLKRFESRFREGDALVKVALHNSLDIGWKLEDIVLYTNFEYEYMGIKSIILPDDLYCPWRPLATKTYVNCYLMEQGMFPDDICWVHDFDAFENYPVSDVTLDEDMGACTYGFSDRWQLGSYFIKRSGYRIMRALREEVTRIKKWEDEHVLMLMTKDKRIEGIKLMNQTYDLGMRRLDITYPASEKPIRVLHFHPGYNDSRLYASTNDMFFHGKNDFGVQLMSDRLKKIFREYGYI